MAGGFRGRWPMACVLMVFIFWQDATGVRVANEFLGSDTEVQDANFSAVQEGEQFAILSIDALREAEDSEQLASLEGRSDGRSTLVARVHPIRYDLRNSNKLILTGKRFSAAEAQGSVKLLIGVTSISPERDVRMMHRGSWMKHQKACPPERLGEPSCNFAALFVLGDQQHLQQSDAIAEAKEFKDVLFLPGLPEVSSDGCFAKGANRRSSKCLANMVQKVYGWFKHALHHVPSATHVAKMESDVNPAMRFMLSDLQAGPRSHCFYGNLWTERKFRNTNCTSGAIQGAFYAITRDLLAPVMAAAGPRLPGAGHEDKMFTGWVFDAQRRSEFRMTCSDAQETRWVHRKSNTPADFARMNSSLPAMPPQLEWAVPPPRKLFAS